MTAAEMRAGRGIRRFWRAMRLVVVYSLVWLILAGSEPASWIIGIPAVLLAVTVSFLLAPQAFFAVNPLGALLFIPYFLGLSVRSGLDVLLRTFSPGPRIKPGMFTYRTGLTGSARVLLANVISLLPGTLSADLREEEVTIHVLDTDMPVRPAIEMLEKRIAGVFLQQSAEEVQ